MNNSNNKNIQKPLYQSRSRYRTKNQSKINLDLIRATNRQNDKCNHHRTKIKNSIKILPENYRTNYNFHKNRSG